MSDDIGPLVLLRPGDTRPPLFCLPAASGSPYSYNALARLLDPGQPVHGFEAPGFDDDRQPVSSFDVLVADYCAALLKGHAQPYHLLGWSMGGVLALEVARRLDAAGAEVALVVLVDAPSPLRAEPPEESLLITSFLYDLVNSGGLNWADMAERTLGDQPEQAFADVERSGLLPEGIDAMLLSRRYAVFRAHVTAICAHERTDVYRGSPVVLIRAALSDPDATRWHPYVKDLTEHVVAGDHHTMWTGDSLLHISRVVREGLRRTHTGAARD